MNDCLLVWLLLAKNRTRLIGHLTFYIANTHLKSNKFTKFIKLRTTGEQKRLIVEQK
jgi:hypothetical protein